jgi:hypothetical protein
MAAPSKSLSHKAKALWRRVKWEGVGVELRTVTSGDPVVRRCAVGQALHDAVTRIVWAAVGGNQVALPSGASFTTHLCSWTSLWCQ